MKTRVFIPMVVVIAVFSALASLATPPNVTVGAPYPNVALEGSRERIYFFQQGLSDPQYPDFLWFCHYQLVNHDGIDSYTTADLNSFELPYYATPGYYKVVMCVCGQGGYYYYSSPDSVFRIIPNDFIRRSVEVTPTEVPANEPMEITATISAENGLTASFDSLNIGTEQESYVTEVVLMKDEAIAMQDKSFKCNGNTLKANFDFSDADTGMYSLRIRRDYSIGTYTHDGIFTYIYSKTPIHVTKCTIQPYINSIEPKGGKAGEITRFKLLFKHLMAKSGSSDSPDKIVRKLFLTKPNSDTIDILTYYYDRNSVTGYICVPPTADTGTYSIFAEVQTDNGVILFSSDSLKFSIYKNPNPDFIISADPKEITCGDSVTLTVNCSSKFYGFYEYNCYITNTAGNEQYSTNDFVLISDSVFTCRAFIPETLSTQFCDIRVTYGYWNEINGVALLKANRRQFRVSIAPDSVIAGESQLFDIKVSQLSDRMRFTSALPDEVSAEYCSHRCVSDSIFYTNDSTLRCRFTFPFVAEKKPINVTLKYPFGTINVGKTSEFSVKPALKIVGVSTDTIIADAPGSIVIATIDDNFTESDIKSITFSSEEPTLGGQAVGGAYNRWFSAYQFKKIGPAQLQAWFHTNYEDSSRVYYIRILKTDSTVWLPVAVQKIVVINPMLSAEDNQSSDMIRVEPNPANTDSYIVFGTGLVGETELTIVGMDGSETKSRLSLNNQSTESRLPLSEFVSNPGAYLIRISNGTRTQTIKIALLK